MYKSVCVAKPKDSNTIWQKSRVIYRYKCGKVDCEEEYIGKSDETFAERYKDHMKDPSPIITLLVIFPLTILASWAEKIKIWQDPSK